MLQLYTYMSHIYVIIRNRQKGNQQTQERRQRLRHRSYKYLRDFIYYNCMQSVENHNHNDIHATQQTRYVNGHVRNEQHLLVFVIVCFTFFHLLANTQMFADVCYYVITYVKNTQMFADVCYYVITSVKKSF